MSVPVFSAEPSGRLAFQRLAVEESVARVAAVTARGRILRSVPPRGQPFPRRTDEHYGADDVLLKIEQHGPIKQFMA